MYRYACTIFAVVSFFSLNYLLAAAAAVVLLLITYLEAWMEVAKNIQPFPYTLMGTYLAWMEVANNMQSFPYLL